MNSTSRVQSHSNNIIQNFMVAGLSQATLKDKMSKSLKEQGNIPPEVLFSLFREPDEQRGYLKFVFPLGIQIE